MSADDMVLSSRMKLPGLTMEVSIDARSELIVLSMTADGRGSVIQHCDTEDVRALVYLLKCCAAAVQGDGKARAAVEATRAIETQDDQMPVTITADGLVIFNFVGPDCKIVLHLSAENARAMAVELLAACDALQDAQGSAA